MWDAHCHLADIAPEQIKKLLEKTSTNQVEYLISNTTNFTDFDSNIDLAKSHRQIYFCLGLHPLYVEQLKIADIDTKFRDYIEQNLSNPKFLALGEIGLDYRGKLSNNDKHKQIDFLIYQLELAQKYDKPVVLHVQKAHNQVLEILKRLNFTKGGMIHAFNSGLEQARAYTDLGFKLGVGMAILNPAAKKLQEKISKLHINNIVLETDSPFMAINQAEQNQPENLTLVANKLSVLLNKPTEKIRQKSVENTKTLFKIKL